jgi:hypothetical protein
MHTVEGFHKTSAEKDYLQIVPVPILRYNVLQGDVPMLFYRPRYFLLWL